MIDYSCFRILRSTSGTVQLLEYRLSEIVDLTWKMSDEQDSIASAYLEPESNVFHVPDSHVGVAVGMSEEAAMATSLNMELVSAVPGGRDRDGRSLGASGSLVVSAGSAEGQVRVVDISNLEADMVEFRVTHRAVVDMEIVGNFLIATDGVGVSVGKVVLGVNGAVKSGISLTPVVYIPDLRRGEEEIIKVHWNGNAPGIFVTLYK